MPKYQLAMFVSPYHPSIHPASLPRRHSNDLLNSNTFPPTSQKLVSSEPVNGAYTELYAGLSPDVTEKHNGGWGKFYYFAINCSPSSHYSYP